MRPDGIIFEMAGTPEGGYEAKAFGCGVCNRNRALSGTCRAIASRR